MAQSAVPRYQPAGFFRPTTLLLFVGATAGGIAVAWLYQFLCRVIPFIQLNFLICAGFGVALGGAGWAAVKWGHCRNRILAFTLALPLALVPLAASYYWDYQHVRGEIGEAEPITFRDYLALKQEAGWKIGHSGSPFNGAGVLLVWGVEALAVFGFTLYGVGLAVGEPYCEKCNRWCADKSYLVRGANRTHAEPLLAKGDLGALAMIDPPAGGGDASVNLTFTVTACAGCRDTAFLTVEEKTTTVSRKKTQEKTRKLIKYAILRSDHLQKTVDRLNGIHGQKLAAG